MSPSLRLIIPFPVARIRMYVMGMGFNPRALATFEACWSSIRTFLMFSCFARDIASISPLPKPLVFRSFSFIFLPDLSSGFRIKKPSATIFSKRSASCLPSSLPFMMLS